MKNLLIAGLFLLWGIAGYAQQWTYVGAPGISPGDSSNWQNLRVSPTGEIYLSFNDRGLSGGSGVVMTYNGTAWDTVGAAGFTPGAATQSAMAMSSSSDIYFVYSDGLNAGRSSVMHFDGTSWDTLGGPLSIGQSEFNRIELNGLSQPYVAFIDYGDAEKIIVKTFDGTNWVNVGPTAAVSDSLGDFPDLAFNSVGELFLAFQDRAANDSVTVKRFDGTSWVTVGSSFLAQPFAGALDLDLAFDNNNVPYVSYMNPLTGPKPYVHRFDGTNWVSIGPGPAWTSFVGFTQLAFDINNNPYLAYHDISVGAKASVIRYDGTSWTHVGQPAVTTGVASFLSLQTDVNGNLFLAFSDGAEGDKTSVMTFTVCEAPTVATVSPDVFLCAGDSTTFSVTGLLNDATNWYWYENGCGGTPVDSGTSITVAPSLNTAYFVRGFGGCLVATSCEAVTVTMYAIPDTPQVTVSGLFLSVNATSFLYQWYFNGVAIPGAVGSTYTADSTGEYQVVEIGNCESAPSVPVFVEVCENATEPMISSERLEYCENEPISLSLSGSLNEAINWAWYLDSCSGTSISLDTVVQMTLTKTTTFYARGEGGCINPGLCASLTITANPLPAIPTISANGTVLSSSAATGNQWFLNGDTIPGATDPQYTATEPGIYTVGVNENGCESVSEDFDFSVGIADQWAEGSIRVYPNPFEDRISIELSQSVFSGQLLRIDILDITGRQVHVAQVETREHQDLVLPVLPPGAYLIRIQSASGKRFQAPLMKH